MRYLWGIPANCQQLGQFTYRHRGQVTFQLYRHGGLWGCDGFPPPTTLRTRSINRSCGFPPDLTPTTVQHEAGWLHLRKNATVRAVCRAIDSELKQAMQEDARLLEAKGLNLPVS